MVLMKLFSGQQWRYKHREKTYGHGWREEGEGGTSGETHMETYITMCKRDSQREFAVCPRELKPGLSNKYMFFYDKHLQKRRQGKNPADLRYA